MASTGILPMRIEVQHAIHEIAVTKMHCASLSPCCLSLHPPLNQTQMFESGSRFFCVLTCNNTKTARRSLGLMTNSRVPDGPRPAPPRPVTQDSSLRPCGTRHGGPGCSPLPWSPRGLKAIAEAWCLGGLDQGTWKNQGFKSPKWRFGPLPPGTWCLGGLDQGTWKNQGFKSPKWRFGLYPLEPGALEVWTKAAGRTKASNPQSGGLDLYLEEPGIQIPKPIQTVEGLPECLRLLRRNKLLPCYLWKESRKGIGRAQSRRTGILRHALCIVFGQGPKHQNSRGWFLFHSFQP